MNNDGGGIFSFLPAAEQVPEETFTELWATPQHVDLMGAPPPTGASWHSSLAEPPFPL